MTIQQESKESENQPSIFPGPLRAKPEYFLAGKGRYGVFYLVDHLFRALVWGPSTRGGTLRIDVETDGTVKIKRTFPEDCVYFDNLGDQLLKPGEQSFAASLFKRYFAAIQSGKHHRLEPTDHNPYIQVFLPLTIAFSQKATLEFVNAKESVSQNFENGNPTSAIKRGGGGNPAIKLHFVLDNELLAEEIRAYPFRVRLQELSCLAPGIRVELRYKGFKPVQHQAEHGVKELADVIIGDGDRLHEEPFLYDVEKKGLRFTCALYLVNSEMERIKSFAGFDECYHGGDSDKMFREVLTDVLKRLHNFEFPERRQSRENIASSRMTYFGTFGATVPFPKEERGNEFVRILPGVAAVIKVDSSDLKWENNYRSRLTCPELETQIQPELVVEFRRWLLGLPDLVGAWKKQWAPKKRKRRTTSSTKTTDTDSAKEENEGKKKS